VAADQQWFAVEEGGTVRYRGSGASRGWPGKRPAADGGNEGITRWSGLGRSLEMLGHGRSNLLRASMRFPTHRASTRSIQRALRFVVHACNTSFRGLTLFRPNNRYHFSIFLDLDI
jgi:hypothetical protein